MQIIRKQAGVSCVLFIVATFVTNGLEFLESSSRRMASCSPVNYSGNSHECLITVYVINCLFCFCVVDHIVVFMSS